MADVVHQNAKALERSHTKQCQIARLREYDLVCRFKPFAGTPWTWRMVYGAMSRAAKRAGLTKRGVHILRHTFCSHLAMKGAPARAIQELAGHESLSTTQRYMHLSPAAIDRAIRLLDGDIVETKELVGLTR
jgi:site-specific recombinase XerD